MNNTALQLLAEIETFRAKTGMSVRQFGVGAVGDHNLIPRLRGRKGVSSSTIDRVRNFIDTQVKLRGEPVA